MAEKETARPNFGLKVQEADKYREHQHKLFTETATGDQYQFIMCVWDYDDLLGHKLFVVMAYSRLPRYKTTVAAEHFDDLFYPTPT